MAGLFFSRKSKNGVGASADPETVSPDSQTVYSPLSPSTSLLDEPPDAIPGIPDLYAVLGVDPRASDDIIRYAYRKRAAKLLDARWRPGRAARRLAELNAAYEILGKPDRRADYDRQRARMYYYQQAARLDMLDEQGALPPGAMTTSRGNRSSGGWLRPRAPRGLLEAIAIIGVVAVAVYAGYTVLGSSSLVDLGGLQDAGGFARAAGPTAHGADAVASAGSGPADPDAAPGDRAGRFSALADGGDGPDASVNATGRGTREVGCPVSNPSPPRRTEISIVLKLTRGESEPIKGVPVYLVAHYKTVEERFPAGDGTVATNDNGEATITFNIGDATAGFPVNVDVIAKVDNEDVKAQTTFLPR